MTPKIYFNMDKKSKTELKKGLSLISNQSIDSAIFNRKLSASNWPVAKAICKKEGISPKVDYFLSALIGRLVPQKLTDRLANRLEKGIQEAFYELSEHELSDRGYVLDRRKLESKPFSIDEAMYDHYIRTGELGPIEEPISYPDGFVLNYFRSAKPIGYVLEHFPNDLARFDVVIPCGELNPQRVEWEFI